MPADVGGCTEIVYNICYLTHWIWRLVPPSQLLIGTLGNVFNVIILRRPRIKRYSTSIYLLVLAFSDVTFLWTTVLPYVYEKVNNIKVGNVYPVLCYTLPWINHITGGFSVSVLVLMTIERVRMTTSLSYSRTKMTSKYATKLSLSVLAACIVLNSHYFVGFEMRHNFDNTSLLQDVSATPVKKNSINMSIPDCSRRFNESQCSTLLNNLTTPLNKISSTTFNTTDSSQHQLVDVPLTCEWKDSFRPFYMEIWPYLVMLVFSVIPTLIIATGNVYVGIMLWKQKKKLMARVHPQSDVQISVIPCKDLPEMQMPKIRLRPISKMLFFVSAFFLVTSLPYTIYQCIWMELDDTTAWSRAKRDLYDALLDTLLFSNFTFNFFLYCLSGTLFRQEYRAFVRERKAAFRHYFSCVTF